MARRIIPDANTEMLCRLDELGAVSAVDITGNGHTGTAVNGCAGVDVSGDGMPWANARQFVRASDQAIQITAAAALKPVNSVSFGCWIKATAIQATAQWFFVNYGTTTFDGYFADIGATGTPYIRGFVTAAAGNRTIQVTDFTSYLGSWAHFAYTYDGQWSRLYLNGDEKVSQDHGSVSAIIYDSTNMYLGGWPPFDGTEKRYLDGYMAEPFVKPNYVMTPWEIKEIYAAVTDPAAGLKP